MKSDWKRLAIALAAGFGGALFALFLGLPAAALLGSTFAVTVAALRRLEPAVPDLLRDIGFCVIGVSLGSGVTPDIWSDIARWPLSIAMLALTVLAVLLVCGLILRKIFDCDVPTALLATSPGALSYTLSLAADRGIDLRFVMVLQSLRLFLITMLLPPMIGYAGGGVGNAPHVDLPHLGHGWSALLLVATFALGMAMTRMRAPAPFIMAGLLVSGIAHGSGLVSGRLADAVTFFGFSITGTVIGARFAGISAGDLKRLAVAGLVSTAAAVLVSVLGAGAVSMLLDLPFGQTWVSFAPGGVEGMSSMALALGYDPVYVATHHVFRIVLLIAILPVLLGLVTRKTV
ncbi:AbrB family transcriptional regulator [Oricola thermophila]|uniref:AbrB family transcriptional regulator n=1 Tax=Oricola thermophila TaxID=2742145 RepID=A0A6N1VJU7_9HYPH|nr:AbrB family transcriptional regulator [Oricola thermophila]QKV19197.1 AbrB family transcriptional regulator [Oricola thermophila]